MHWVHDQMWRASQRSLVRAPSSFSITGSSWCPFGCRQRGEHLTEDLKSLPGCGHRGPLADRGENQGPGSGVILVRPPLDQAFRLEIPDESCCSLPS